LVIKYVAVGFVFRHFIVVKNRRGSIELKNCVSFLSKTYEDLVKMVIY